MWPAVLVVLALAATPAPAWSAGSLTAASPADGQALSAAPASVVLTFSSSPDRARSHVSVRDRTGADVGGAPDRAGQAALRLPVTVRSPGDYLVVYHVVFEDGGDLVGTLHFSVGTGVPPAPSSPRAGSALPDGHAHGVDPIGAALVLLDAVVLIAVLLLLLFRGSGDPSR